MRMRCTRCGEWWNVSVREKTKADRYVCMFVRQRKIARWPYKPICARKRRRGQRHMQSSAPYGTAGGSSERDVGDKSMRQNLKTVRRRAGLTQQQVADMLNISLVYYQKIEAGERTGDFAIWDTLEDITGIHQRLLRENVETRRDQAKSQSAR